jgi:adenylate kinase
VIILLFGPPGSGKGTQSRFVAERFAIPAISTGEMLRAECRAGTELGRLAGSILASGGLVDDGVANRLIADRTTAPDCARGFLLDGYPRTVTQAQTLTTLVRQRGWAYPIAVELDVAEPALVRRLTARRQCPVCKVTYNLESQPPRDGECCDLDGAKLTVREDDREQIIRQRLMLHRQQTQPLLEYYGRDRMQRVDGGAEPAQVAQSIVEAVNRLSGRCRCKHV